MKKKNPKKAVGARVSVYWPDDLKILVLTPRNWAKVRSGNPLGIRGEGYIYDAEFFWDYWYFEGGLDGDLTVGYGDEGGVGFTGKLRDVTIEEFEYTPKRRRKKSSRKR